MYIYIVQIKKKGIKTPDVILNLSWMTGVKLWSHKLAWMTTKKPPAHYAIHSLSSVWTSFKGLSVASHHLAWVSFSAFPDCFSRHSFYWYSRERHNLYSGKSVPVPAYFRSQEISSHCSMAFELSVALPSLCSCSVSKWCFSLCSHIAALSYPWLWTVCCCMEIKSICLASKRGKGKVPKKLPDVHGHWYHSYTASNHLEQPI